MAEKVSSSKDINTAIRNQLKRSKTVKITGLNGQNYIAVGLTIEKQISFNGSVGDFFGALNSGSILNLTGNARRFVGNTMSSGGIILKGNAQRGVGLAMTGGIIVIRGNVKGDVGQLARGGTILINGSVGANSGAHMANGEIIVVGDIGKNAGLYMVGGVIYVGGKIESLGINTQTRQVSQTDKRKLKKYFDHYGVTKDVKGFTKIVPLMKNPLENKLFYIKKEQSRFSPQYILDEINQKAKNGLLEFNGENYSNISFKNYFDRISILPIQTKQTKSIKVFEPDINTTITIGEKLKSPLVLNYPFYLSSRNTGIISKSSKMAFIFAAAKHNIPLNTSGIDISEEKDIISKYDCKIIHPWNNGRLGVSRNYLTDCNAIEIVIGASGAGSLTTVIPNLKITKELQEIWHVPPETDIVIPPKMFDMDVPADLKRHVELLRELTEYKIPIFIKLTSGNIYEDTKLALRAGADAIVLDCLDNSHHHLPEVLANNLGLNSLSSIPPAIRAFNDMQADKKGVRLIVSGAFRNGADVFKGLALGADAVVLNKAAEIAIGCNLCGLCNTNECLVGIATTDQKIELKLDWVEAGQRLVNYLNAINLELKILMMLAGYKKMSDFNSNSLRALDYDTAAVTGLKLAGYDKILPMWEH